MADSFQIRAEGLAPFERQLALLLAAMGDLTPLMDEIGQYGVTSTIDRFDEGVDPQGTPWIPSLRAAETGGKTLVDKALLRNSMTHRAGRDQVEWGTNVKYAARHNQGFSGTETVSQHMRTMREAFGQRLSQPIDVVIPSFQRNANTPKRQFLGLSTIDIAEIEAIGTDYLRDAVPGIEQ